MNVKKYNILCLQAFNLGPEGVTRHYRQVHDNKFVLFLTKFAVPHLIKTKI